jgi:hypothetical protein
MSVRVGFRGHVAYWPGSTPRWGWRQDAFGTTLNIGRLVYYPFGIRRAPHPVLPDAPNKEEGTP